MKCCQFSISGILLLTFLVAIVLSLRGGFGSRWSFEIIWITVFALAYWRSPKSGWSQVLRAIGITGVVWGVLILCMNAWFLNRKGTPSTVELALHAAVLVLAAVVLSTGAACLVEGIRLAARRWARCEWPRRVVLVLAPLALISLVVACWMALRPTYWEPVSVTSTGQPFEEAFPYLDGEKDRPSVKDVWLADASADGRFIAAIIYGGQKVVVLDAACRVLVASFDMASGEGCNDLTFDPGGTVLAVLCHSKTAGPKLLRWDVPSWTPREPASLDHLVGRDQLSQISCLALDRCLLVVCACAVDQRTGKIEISTVDLLDEWLAPRPFACAEVEIKSSSLPTRRALGRFAVPQDWIISPSRNWICGGGCCVSRGRSSLTTLPGKALGFFRDTDCLAIEQRSDALYWNRERHAAVAPPFWNYLHMGSRSRVSIYDCRMQ
ncbi:MAG: hypothetical protein KJZ87_00755 [Thermoguttaceae bacterium]|nr:hypothetical protein [Thermoguttaceae bacterium]